MKKIMKGDYVIVITGKEKGKQGTVAQIIGDKVVVDGINLVKRHQRPNPMRGIEGGISTKAMPLNISNISLFNSKTNKKDKAVFKSENIQGKERRARVYKSNNENIALSIQRGKD